MSEELKTCPFCNKNSGVTVYSQGYAMHGELFSIQFGVKCKRCGVERGTYSKKETAIKRWNTRPKEDALKAEITRYRRALHNLKEDCTRRKHFAISDEEKLFLYETISHIEAELDFNIASGERGDDE